MERKQINRLILEKMAGVITPEDDVLLGKWLSESDEHRRQYESFMQRTDFSEWMQKAQKVNADEAWEQFETMHSLQESSREGSCWIRSLHSLQWLRYAAVFVIAVAMTAIFLLRDHHQVKTPVSNLKMVTDTLLTKSVTDQERIDFLQGIRSQTDKLDFLFQALVKTSRLETGAILLEKKDRLLFDTLAQAMSGIVYGAEKKDITVTVDCPEDLHLSHDGKWTAEALFNLLDNAVKYTPNGGKVSVSVEQWEMYVKLSVADTGKGISESNQASIFQRFYREEEVHDEQGVGIGLYLAREIITRQGGYIKVTSVIGKGSTFSVFLPIRC